MLDYLICNTALGLGLFLALVGYSWVREGNGRIEVADAIRADVIRKIAVLHEAIELHNYGADDEAIKLLREERFHVIDG